MCGFLDGHFPVAAPFAEACQPSGYHVCDGLGLVHACLAMLGAMCQYDPECPVHRHRPGTTCPVVYRKRMAVIREQERREQQRQDRIAVLEALVGVVVVCVVGYFIACAVAPDLVAQIRQAFGI